MAQKWITAASKRDLNMLNSEVIARMLLSGLTTINTTLGYDNTTTEMAKKFLQNHSESLIELVFESREQFNTIVAKMGLGPQPAEESESSKPKEMAQSLCEKLKNNQLSQVKQDSAG